VGCQTVGPVFLEVTQRMFSQAAGDRLIAVEERERREVIVRRYETLVDVVELLKHGLDGLRVFLGRRQG